MGTTLQAAAVTASLQPRLASQPTNLKAILPLETTLQLSIQKCLKFPPWSTCYLLVGGGATNQGGQYLEKFISNLIFGMQSKFWYMAMVFDQTNQHIELLRTVYFRRSEVIFDMKYIVS